MAQNNGFTVSTKQKSTVLAFQLIFERLDDSPQLFPETFQRIEHVKTEIWPFSEVFNGENIFRETDFDSDVWNTATIDDCPKPVAWFDDGELFADVPGYRLKTLIATPEQIAAMRLQFYPH